jgi:hypothetical protein
VDVGAEVLDGDSQRLAKLLQSAEPRLLSCGGARRLLVVAPERTERATIAAAVRQAGGPEPTIAGEPGCDLVLCYDVQRVPLAYVARQLLGDRRDFAELASRLHGRNDVAWAPWPEALGEV